MLTRIEAMKPVFPNTALRILCLLSGLLIVAVFAALAQPNPVFIVLGLISIVMPLSDLSRSYSLTLAALLRLSGILFAIVVIVLSLYSLFS
jgi:hypothetical protein